MKRKDFLKLLAASPLFYAGMKLTDLNRISEELPASDRMPVIFVGHGSPMNALFDNGFTQSLAQIRIQNAKPKAILVVSAHWETKGTYVSVNPAPKTIYDFGGFPEEMYKIKYEPKGHPELARETAALGLQYHIQEDHTYGLDHGAWTVLKHIYPEQDIPVFQMSLDYTKPALFHLELAQSLKKLREKGVLILASGNIVHNLRIIDFRNQDAKPFDWAQEFDELVKDKLQNRDFEALAKYEQFGRVGQMAIPTPEHFLPLMYTNGLSDTKDQLKWIYEGMEHGSISMRCLQFS
jgi:4,5-DOPA dioxygenase extradiol